MSDRNLNLRDRLTKETYQSITARYEDHKQRWDKVEKELIKAAKRGLSGLELNCAWLVAHDFNPYVLAKIATKEYQLRAVPDYGNLYILWGES